MSASGEEVVERLLAHYQTTHPLWQVRPDGAMLVNHGTMAIDALFELGFADAEHADALLAKYYPERLVPFAMGAPIADDARVAALGDEARIADWIATFDVAIANEGAEVVLRRALPALFDGVMGGSLHGLVRTGHATRMLARRDTPLRRRELAFGLGLWAGTFQRLPGQPGRAPSRTPSQVLATIPPLPRADRPSGILSARVVVLEGDAAFAAAIDAMDLAVDVGAEIARIEEAMARLLLTHPRAKNTYLHAMTTTSLFRVLAPYVDARLALGAFVRALAAVHAVSVETTPFEGEAPATDPRALARDAAGTLDDHTIKLAATAIREAAREDCAAPNVILLAASRSLAGTL